MAKLVAELRVLRKDGPEDVVEIYHVPFVLGRNETDLDLNDHAISRKHCEVVHVGGKWIIRDLQSSNGTYVNGEKIMEQALQDGDRLRLGQTEIRFTLRPAAGLDSAKASAKDVLNLVDNTALWNIVELSVGAAADEKHWLRSYLETVIKQFHSDRGVIVTHESLTGAVMPAVALGLDFSGDTDREKIALSQLIMEQAIRDRKAVVTTNAKVGQSFEETTGDAQDDVCAVMCAPARWQGVPVGAVYLERALAKEPYHEEEAQQLQDLADLLGTARMAWRGHLMSGRGEWEREHLGRTFPDPVVNTLLAQGGASAVKRQVREVCVVAVHLSKLDEMLASGHEEIWRMISQLYAQLHEILQRHGGAVLASGCAQFGSLEGEETGFHAEAVRSGVEIQRAARPMIRRLTREMKVNLAVSVGVATGKALVGYFGAGRRMDYLGMGEAFPTAYGIAYQAEDGEVLVEQTTYDRVRTNFNTHRMAPVMLPGVKSLTPLFRIVPY